MSHHSALLARSILALNLRQNTFILLNVVRLFERERTREVVTTLSKIQHSTCEHRIPVRDARLETSEFGAHLGANGSGTGAYATGVLTILRSLPRKC